ncbi:MAG: 2,3-diphosphoglycerate-dependent phosphoglycerate mutase [Chitinophagaceae bacterium]|nr:2,3-diphosphoglycerate-dependent phosphoglycerate mutase [Chitinophagaceae bacterium]MCO5241185.1 2,3-diphosphoglycerate-dependent phosphoglycerate mutase [Chitinophagaceae bacterium]
MPLLVIVRHGQSQWNLENRFTGIKDVSLTALGREEARVAGKKLKNIVFDHAFTSLLGRAQETLSIILGEIDQVQVPVEKNQALNERDYGELQGLNKAEVVAQYGAEQVQRWRRSYDLRPPGGESLKDTAARVIPFYQQEMEPLLIAGRNILVVAHGNSLRALMMYLEKISAADISNVNIPTGAPRVYTFSTHLKLVDALYL